ncbi:unnamed protein product [Urochloa humidicola]
MPDTKVPGLAAAVAAAASTGMFHDDDPLDPPPPAAAGGGAAANGGLILKAQPEFAARRGTSSPCSSTRRRPPTWRARRWTSSPSSTSAAAWRARSCSSSSGPWASSSTSWAPPTASPSSPSPTPPAGKAAAKQAVELLGLEGGTNIGEGLRVGAQVLSSRRHRNAVAAVILLSDGQDTVIGPAGRTHASLVPPAFAGAAAASRPAPIHTFGFGADHNAAAMHAVAAATGGTFCFVKDEAAVQDAFARCVGGLLSVAVQEARVAVSCLHRGVRVQEVRSGAYVSGVAADGRSASIDAGELYDGERRRFLVLVYVPKARAAESSTRLVKVTCTYRDAATGQAARAAAPAAVIQRPAELEHMPAPAIEVERERVRLAAADGIAAARAAADGGQHAGAARILDARLREVERSAPGAAGDDPTCEAIKEELRDLSARVGDSREYNQTGRACLLAGMSAHAQQRAAGVEAGSSGTSPATAGKAYLTPKMEEMVELSRESSRKRGSSSQQPSRQDVIKQIKQDLTEHF